jgi:hypothetical protein
MEIKNQINKILENWKIEQIALNKNNFENIKSIQIGNYYLDIILYNNIECYSIPIENILSVDFMILDKNVMEIITDKEFNKFKSNPI